MVAIIKKNIRKRTFHLLMIDYKIYGKRKNHSIIDLSFGGRGFIITSNGRLLSRDADDPHDIWRDETPNLESIK